LSSAGSAVLPRDERPEPRPTVKLLPNGVMGMLLFVFTEAMLFAGLISAHTIVKSGAAGQMWPPFGQPRLPVEDTAFNTAALLLSGVLLVFAQLAFRKKASRALGLLLASVLLGTFFVVFQGVEWAALISEGLTLQSSSYGGFFYLIVGTHALHAIAAILGLAWAWFRLKGGRLTAAQFGTVQVFWYFVVLVWPVLYLRVYL
jgi:cytochrome c oxidase subunit 3